MSAGDDGAADLELAAHHAAELERAVRSEVEERVAAGKLTLPLLPQVASQVLMLAGNANTDAAQLSALIHRDPALAGQVLRISNSAAYTPRMPIVSLQQAVARLGLNTVTEMALVASMQSGTFKVPGFEGDLKKLWRHAVASAVFAKEIARARRFNVEAAFLCGLLHQVGKPALLQLVVDVGRTRDKSQPRSNDVAVGRGVLESLLQRLHVGVGLRIAELWGLPRLVANAIATYDRYDQGPPPFSPEAMITCLSDRLATDLVYPGAWDAQQPCDHPVVGHLNLYPEDVTALLAKRPLVSSAVDSMTT